MVAPIQIGAGIEIGAGISLGASSTPPSATGTITYAQMNPPVIPGFQLEDATATVNGSVGFTINDSGATGVAVTALSSENQTFFGDQGTGLFTATFGAGSSYSTATVNIVSIDTTLTFFIDDTLSYPATFNYPFIIT